MMSRFRFGKNWTSYAANSLTAQKVTQAGTAFRRLLEPASPLVGKSFLDIGFGQGLSAHLAAESGAKVTAIDIDKDNLDAISLTAQYFQESDSPKFEIASILDADWVEQHQSSFDIVHSWGVLHHTGNMLSALVHAGKTVKPDGFLILALYNQHWSSLPWKWIKWSYVHSPTPAQRLLIFALYPIIFISKFLVTGQHPNKKDRGMNFYYDVIDWVGGYPYEYIGSEELTRFMSSQGFTLVRHNPTEVPTGCNEFIFRNDPKL